MSPGQRLASGAGAEAGFTLLEGLVAIAVLAGTMAAIFALVGGILNSAHRVGRSNETAQITLNAMQAMTLVNPMLQESGKIDLGEYAVSWKSAAITPVSDGSGYPGGISLYQLALYQSDIRVEGEQGRLLTVFKLRQIGYQRVREPPPPLKTPSVAGLSR